MVLTDMRQVISHARAGRAQTIYRTITVKSQSERVEEGASIIAMAFATELQLAA